MEFKSPIREKLNKEKYEDDVLDVAYKFAIRTNKEFGTFIRAITLFGSAAKNTEKKESKERDIDILVVIDDVRLEITEELAQTYRIMIEKIISDISPRLHITTLKLTSVWEYARAGDPVIINILRDGVNIIDTGFFEPLQILLKQGRIRPTPESVWNYFVRAPTSLHNANWHILKAISDMYWAVIDSAHAALMKIREIPTSPEKVAEMMKEKLVAPGVIEKKYPKIMEEFYDISKKIQRGEIKRLTGLDYDKYYAKAKDFVERMQRFIEKK